MSQLATITVTGDVVFRQQCFYVLLLASFNAVEILKRKIISTATSFCQLNGRSSGDSGCAAVTEGISSGVSLSSHLRHQVIPIASISAIFGALANLNFNIFQLHSGNLIRQNFSLQNFRQCWRYGIQWRR